MLLGALLIMWAAYRGLAAHWQTIPSTWDAVWHANEVRFILDTGQASSTHMGELRNVETHQTLYYPSVFHALIAVFCQLTGAAPTTGYTLSSVAASVWLFPTSAAMLTWHLLRRHTTEWRSAGAAATAAALSASFTAVPYVEFGVAAMPNLAAYGVAVPTFVLITTTLRHRDRIPAAVLAWVGVMSVHITGGVIVVLFLVAWWLMDACGVRCAAGWPTLTLWPRCGGRRADPVAAVHQRPAGRKTSSPGTPFPTYLSKKRGIFDAVFQHSRHLNDFPVQYGLIAVAGHRRGHFSGQEIWWPLAVGCCSWSSTSTPETR